LSRKRTTFAFAVFPIVLKKTLVVEREFGYNHMDTVNAPLMVEVGVATATYWLDVETKLRQSTYLQDELVSQVGLFMSVPEFPFPEASVVVDPLPSSRGQ
jgi:hypothetical protein